MSKNLKHGQNFRMSKKGPRTWDQYRKMVFRLISGEIRNVKKFENFWSKFSNVQKGPQGPLEHGIDV